MKALRTFGFTVAVVFCAVSGVFGQGTRGQESTGEISQRFRVVGFGDSFFEGLKYENDEGDSVELTFVPNRRSRWYPQPKRRGRLEVFREETDARGRVTRIPQAQVELLSQAEESLFVFLSEEGRSRRLPFRTLSVDESEGVFGPGDYRFLNLTGVPLKGQLGNKVFDVPSGLSPIVRPPEDEVDGFPIRFAVETRDGWRVTHSTRTRADRLYGAFYLLKPPLEAGSLRLRVERLW